MPPLILWFRRDLRLADNPMLAEAAQTGCPLLPVFVLDPETESLGAAARWRLGEALVAFSQALAAKGLRLHLARGAAGEVLERLARATGASGLWWGRLYDAPAVARDSAVKARLRGLGIEAKSFPGHLLHEPFGIQTSGGGGYRVFTPFWNAIRARDPGPARPGPARLRGWDGDPGAGERLADWRLGQAMRRGAAVVARHALIGETAARDRLHDFLHGPVADYPARRDRLDRRACSGLSEPLAWGEIGPREIWHAARSVMEGAQDPGVDSGSDSGAAAFLRQLGWRDFAWHLLYHFPQMGARNWRAEWDAFPWRGDSAEAEAWRRGRTGEPVVDAAMRELYATGRMHNRARMIVASYLTKHLLTDWRLGLDWFADCLTDWDPAANALNWQWVAGSGPDAAPFFRIFNPQSQAQKFDPEGRYRDHWLKGVGADDFYAAAPLRWRLDPAAPPPVPLIGLAEGRARALAAWNAGKA